MRIWHIEITGVAYLCLHKCFRNTKNWKYSFRRIKIVRAEYAMILDP